MFGVTISEVAEVVPIIKLLLLLVLFVLSVAFYRTDCKLHSSLQSAGG